jgi:hypothetical protein
MVPPRGSPKANTLPILEDVGHGLSDVKAFIDGARLIILFKKFLTLNIGQSRFLKWLQIIAQVIIGEMKMDQFYMHQR